MPDRGVIGTSLKATEQGRSLQTTLWAAAIILFFRPMTVQSHFYYLPCSNANPADSVIAISCVLVVVVYLVQ